LLFNNLGRELDLVLVLEQEQGQALERSCGSFEINDTHTLIKDGQDCAHEVVGVREFLDLLPFGLFLLTSSTEDGLVLLFLILNTCFSSVDLFITLSFRLFDHLNEIVHLHDGSGRMHLDNVHVDEFIVRNGLSGDNITAINDTIISEVGIVIKEDLLSVVVSLIDHHQFSSNRLFASVFPAIEVLLDKHRARFLKSL
jgi:hypothetical protein